VAQYDRDTSKELLTEQYILTKEMVWPDPKAPLGKIDVSAWEQTKEMMLAQKLIPKPVEVVTILKTGSAP